MKLIGNVIWFFIYGLWISLIHFALGVAFCATGIFIPWGLQCFKIASYAIRPFGRHAITNFDSYPKSNLIWCVFMGWPMAVIHTIVGVVLCLAIIGIPFAKKCFSLAALQMTPFGADVG